MGTLLYSTLRIEEMVRELAGRLNTNLPADSKPVFVILLNGGAFLGVDLVRNIKIPHEVIFATVKSLGEIVEIKITGDEEAFITNRHIVVVDEFLDTGYTLKGAVDVLNNKGALSTTIATLLVRNKKVLENFQKTSVKDVFYGDILKTKDWLYGYGLDHPNSITGDDYRSLMEIRSINK